MKKTMVGPALMVGLLMCLPAQAAQVEILTPAQRDVVHDNAGNLTVVVRSEPPLDQQRGRAIRILLDGQPVAESTSATSFALQGVERGEHWLQAVVINGKGQAVLVSETVYFTMWQASINAPPRKKK